MPITMRIPTSDEWDRMMDVCQENNQLTHWKDMYSWVDDESERQLEEPFCIARGYAEACYWAYGTASGRRSYIGFRPAFDNLPLDAPDNGAVKVIGTLYMDGIPVCIPDDALDKSCIPDYIPGAKLEMREPLDDPQYQVQAIKVGSTYIADRVLLKNISYKDIVTAITTKED